VELNQEARAELQQVVAVLVVQVALAARAVYKIQAVAAAVADVVLTHKTADMAHQALLLLDTQFKGI
jgi:hypothetical protein